MLTTILLAGAIGLTGQAARQQVPVSTTPRLPSAPSTAFNNADLLHMHAGGFPEDVILAKMRTTACDFNTSPEALAELQRIGLSQRLVLAMLEAPRLTQPSREHEEATRLRDFVPLFQALVWPLLLGGILLAWRSRLSTLLAVVTGKVRRATELEVGGVILRETEPIREEAE